MNRRHYNSKENWVIHFTTEMEHDLMQAAQGVANALSRFGYVADFSPGSLVEVDRFFEENVTGGTPRPDGLLGQELGARLVRMGGYVGEVVRRATKGQWRCDEHDPQGEMNVSVLTGEGLECYPVQRVMKRLRNGSEDSIVTWALSNCSAFSITGYA